MSNETLLSKVIVSTEIGAPPGSGLLKPDQSNRFIDYMFDKTVLVKQVRTERMRADSMELDRMGVGERLMRPATEAVDTGENQGVTFSKISLRTYKLRLDWELSTESLEDNIEQEGFEDHVAQLMAEQAGNDIEDLAINGDVASADPLLVAFDGWRKLAVSGTTDGAAHIVDAGGTGLTRETANRALKSIPRKFLQRRGSLRFYTGAGLAQDYAYSLTTDEYLSGQGQAAGSIGNVVAEGGAGWLAPRIMGQTLQEVPLFNESRTGTYSGATGNHGDVWLTDPKNLILGVKRDIQVFREFKPKKDSIEFTVFTRIGVGIENTDAMVVVTNNRLAA